MKRQYPVFTAESQCQDCYKCVRHCPVKAIRVVEGRAAVISDRCVACGTCIRICPADAKRIRNDVQRALHLLEGARPVYVSLAPSWVADFPDVDGPQMVAALRRLGLAGVSETALGAEAVSARLVTTLHDRAPGLLISTACPAAVDFIRQYVPDQTQALSQTPSPAMAHAELLRQAFGDEIEVIFIGPCVAKKFEADRDPERIALALTFKELRQWLEQAEIDPATISPAKGDRFEPESAADGAIYPIEGGMNRTLEVHGLDKKVDRVCVAGLPRIEQALAGQKSENFPAPVFVECLACEGGCLGGPGMDRPRLDLDGQLRIGRNARMDPRPEPDRARMRPLVLPARSPEIRTFTPDQMSEALARVGKHSLEDELNCGACGYDTCRHFAEALLQGHAEPAMCASYMRRIAQRKANAILRCMPTGAVIVNAALQVIECNQAFAEVSRDARLAYEARPGLAGASLERLLPVGDLFRTALRTGKDLRRLNLKIDDRLLNLVIFTIDPGQTVGAIVEDVTEMECRREQIVQRAREVIQRNVNAVQEIACRLGEHMSDTEILLESIIGEYEAPPLPPARKEPPDHGPR